MGRRLKIGIDVGGTFTHAVAVDALTSALCGTAVVATSHTAAEGVARGVIESMRRLLANCGIEPREVCLVAHSTTQATNALLEGDVAAVGVVGMGRGWEGWRARSQTRCDGLDLAPGKPLRTCHRFLDTGTPLTEDRVDAALDELAAEGAEVLVASEAFAVDDPRNEQAVVARARERGWLATGASEISQLYGLKVRTRTAVVNASMLPRMLETADRTEEALRESGLGCPLMVMRSDGGIMDVAQMRRRPILTMLSGPAAGVAAALAFVKVSDAIFLEVGGTSTDVSVVRNGRPTVRSAEVGGQRLFVRALDIRTVGVGGGSMVRVRGGRVVDVGPRSAHIAGLGYPSYTPVPEGTPVEVVTVAPRPGDPADYLALRVGGVTTPSLAYTTTDAANAVGSAGDYAQATCDTARQVTALVATELGESPEEVADGVLDRAARKVGDVVTAFIEDYGLERRDLTLVGGGGGADVIVRPVGRRLGLDVRIAERAEVLSAIGVALGMIQDTVERPIVNPTEADLVAARRAAAASVLAMGAVAESIEVKVEVDTRQKRVIATARGTPELRTGAQGAEALRAEALREIAARSCAIDPACVAEVGWAGTIVVFRGREHRARLFGLRHVERHPVRAIDREGVVRLKVPDASVLAAPLSGLPGPLAQVVDDLTVFGDAGGLLPDVFLVVAGRIVDLSGLASRDQVLSLVRAESETLGGDEPAIAVIARKRA